MELLIKAKSARPHRESTPAISHSDNRQQIFCDSSGNEEAETQRERERDGSKTGGEGGRSIITDGRPAALSGKNPKLNRQTNTTV